MKMNQQTSYMPDASEDVAFTASPASFTIPAHIHMIRVLTDQQCKITWKNAGTVVLPPGIPEYFAVPNGDTLTVTQDTTAGTLRVAYMTN